MKIKLEHMIDAGCAGRKNQDAYWAKCMDFMGRKLVLAIVCDGVGGAADGEIASKKTIDHITGGFWANLPQYLNKNFSMEQIANKLDAYLQRANTSLYQSSHKNGVCTGTTVSLYFMLEEEYLIMNVGDSRVYWNKEKGMYRTKDHTVFERNRKKGTAKEEQKHVLWQSIGSQPRVRIDRYMGSVTGPMEVLLLTDGAYRSFSRQEIRQYCRYGNLNRMRKQALKRKEADNMAGIRIEIR